MGVKGADLLGKRFGNLLVIEKVKLGYSVYRWRCVCDCGNESLVRTDHLTSGNTKSCGCKHYDACKTHGMTETRLYHIWCNMKARCLNANNHKHKDYGGRGIKVCDEWMRFEPFAEWALKNGYKDDLSIDRIDNNGNYEPTNCRWVDSKTQANNTRTNRNYSMNGETHTIADWSRIYGVERKMVYKRIRLGWTISESLLIPKNTSRKEWNNLKYQVAI